MRKRYQITAYAYDRKGKLLSIGKNNYNKSHPLSKYFAMLAGESQHKVYLHAEQQACLKAAGKKIHEVKVIRKHNDDTLANAEPCKTCKTMLRAFGVQKVTYSHEHGWKSFEFNEFN